VIVKNGKRFKTHRGMASAAARRVRFAVDRYAVPAKGLDEGIEAYVACTGRAETVITTMTNGLRAAFGYAGAESVQGMWSGATFGLISSTGAEELGAHSLEVKK
jgi:IMP dehydrogenase